MFNKFIFLLAFLYFTSPAVALVMMSGGTCKNGPLCADIIFFGKPGEVQETTALMQAGAAANAPVNGRNSKLPDAYVDFTVNKIYKGAPAKTVRVFFVPGNTSSCTAEGGAFPSPAGELVRANDVRGNFFVVGGGKCDSNGASDRKLKELMEKYEVLDALIAQYPDVPTFYEKKAAMMVEVQDYAGAAALQETMKQKIGAAPDAATFDLGKNQYLAGNFEGALKTLQAATDKTRATAYIQLSLAHLGRIKELDGQRLEFGGQKLSGLTFSKINLKNSDFSGAVLENVTFSDVDLEQANFAKAGLMRVTFEKVRARASDFSGARFRGKISESSFEAVNFSEGKFDFLNEGKNDFTAADFSGARMTLKSGKNTDFSRAKFTKAVVYGMGGADTSGADFTGTSFYAKDMPGIRADDQAMNLAGQKLGGSTFQAMNLANSSFARADLQKADFRGANVSGADFSGANLAGADFTVSHHHGPAHLEGADFSTAQIADVKWEGAIFDCKTRFPAGFAPRAHKLDITDPGCAEGVGKKSPSDMFYSPERLQQGYINLCGGEYHVDCAYAFLTSQAVYGRAGSRFGGNLSQLAESFLKAGETKLARLAALRTVVRPGDDGKYFLGRNRDVLLLLGRVAWADGDTAQALRLFKLAQASNQTKYVNDHPAFMPDFQSRLVEAWIASGDIDGAQKAFDEYYKNNPYLAHGGYENDRLKMTQMLSAARVARREFQPLPVTEPAAVESMYAAQETPFDFDGAIKAAITDGLRRRSYRVSGRDEFIKALTAVAIARYRNGERDFLAGYTSKLPAVSQEFGYDGQPKPAEREESRETIPLRLLAGSSVEDVAREAGQAKYIPYFPGAAEALAARGETKPLLESLGQRIEQSEEKGRIVAVLGKYYAAHPNASEQANFKKALRSLEVERLPVNSDVIFVGGEFRMHQVIFEALADMRDAHGIDELFKKTQGYAHTPLKIYCALYAATAAAKLGDSAHARSYYAAFAKDYETSIRPHEKDRFSIPVREEIAAFAAAAISAAGSGDAASDALKLLDGRDGMSPRGELLIALAKAAAKPGPELPPVLKNAFLPFLIGNPRNLVNGIEILRTHGWGQACKPFLLLAAARAQDARNGREASVLVRIAGDLAEEGMTDAAERIAASFLDPRLDFQDHGLSPEEYDIAQFAARNAALAAIDSGDTARAEKIMTESLAFPPDRATVFFALADAAADEKAKATAYFAHGVQEDPDMFGLVTAFATDAVTKRLDGIIARARTAKMLPNDSEYMRAVAFLSGIINILRNDRQAGDIVMDLEARLASLTGKKNVFDVNVLKKTFPNAGINEAGKLADIAHKLAVAGDKASASEVVAMGLTGITHYPASGAKAQVLIHFAHLLARLERPISHDMRAEIEKYLRVAVPPLRKGETVEPGPADLVAAGEEMLNQLKRGEYDAPIDGR